MSPFELGGDEPLGLDREDDLTSYPHKFEAGTPDAQAVVLGAAIDY